MWGWRRIGEMGIGNTSAAAAVAACLTGAAPSDVIGRGTGVDDAGIARKCAAVARGVARVERGVRPNDPADVLREVGGLEIAAMAGAMIGAAARGRLARCCGRWRPSSRRGSRGRRTPWRTRVVLMVAGLEMRLK